MWCPVTSELETVSNAVDAVVEPIGGGTVGAASIATSWSIQDTRAITDLVTPDNGLQNSYAQVVLSGKSLPVSYSA